MRTIKFRGVDMETGETVYGELGTIFTTCTGDKYYFGSEHSVKPESVEQLIGVDENGAEVYEGDLVELLEYNCLLPPVEATFRHYGKILDGEVAKCEQ